MNAAHDWSSTASPSLDVFERLAAAAWNRLPGHMRQLCGDLVIRVDDFPTDEILDELGIDNALDLLGLYQGISIDKRSVSDLPREPDMVFLYRRPMLDYWSGGDETLGEIVTHVLIHEIGHHFGLSDGDMEAIEAEAWNEATDQRAG